MSTEIRDTVNDDDRHEIQRYDERIEFRARDDGRSANACMTRADFLAAVAKECGAFVRHGGGIVGRDPLTVEQVERTRAHAEALVLATYRVEAVPPVDEARVEALTQAALDWQIARGFTPDLDDNRECVRALLATGRIEVKL